MFLSNSVKYFLSSGLFLFTFTGCGSWQSADNRAGPEIFEIRNELPFPSKEPEVYQAEMVVTTGGSERKIFAAQKGERRRIDYDIDSPDRRSILYAGGKFVILHREKIYAEIPAGSATPSDESLATLLTNSRIYNTFTPLGVENGLARYSAKAAENSSSEVMIFVDEELGMPVRQEFYNIERGNRTLIYTVELRDVKLETGDDLFEIPRGFRQVSIEEFSKRIGRF